MGANFSRNYTEQYSEIVESLHNKTLIVSTLLVNIILGHYFCRKKEKIKYIFSNFANVLPIFFFTFLPEYVPGCHGSI